MVVPQGAASAAGFPNIKKSPAGVITSGAFVVFTLKNYALLRSVAWGPFGPSVISKVTR